MKRLSKGALVLLMLLSSATIWAQNKTVTGRILGEGNQPISGASVTAKNTTIGTTTNDEGDFTLSVPASTQILVISYVGYTSQEVRITGNSISTTLVRGANGNLDEVVVVGYGTQRKRVLTSSITTVKAADLERVPNGRIEQALQGRTSGVTILQNSGQPGSSSTIRVRGITTFNNNNPLWVVDGVVVDAGGIGYLNQSDIESIDVLKDAAAAAIYGTRAAAGVILVTTKKGRAGKTVVSYNGFYGTSAPARMLDLLNASQYATLINEKSVAGGGNVVFNDIASLGKGTDWQKAIFNNDARRWLNEISMSGGSERSTYYLSAGIQKQDGIVATDISDYQKWNFRINSTHKISNRFTFGQTFGYTRQKSKGLGNTNSEFGGPLSSAINLDPTTPIVVTNPTLANAAPYSVNPVIRDANGNPYGISTLVGQEMSNPLAYIQTRLGGYGWSDDFVGNAYLEASIIKGLKIRSTVGAKKAYYGNQGFTPVYYLSATIGTTQNSYNKGENRVFNWNVENTLTYDRVIKDHSFTVLLGQGYYLENNGSSISTTLFNLPITRYQDASFNFDIPQTSRNSGVGDFTEHKIYSLFARANYAFKDKYLFTGIIRRDGSTKFGPGRKYGVFPGFSAGWNIDRESFWSSNKVVSSLKLRGGYGSVGQDALDDFRYVSVIRGGYNYPIGSGNGINTGYAPLTLDNPTLHWEETRTADFGVDAFLFDKINFTVNLFSKKTVGILRPVLIPGYVGVSDLPYDNVADMRNKGIELELGYRKSFGDLNLNVNGNVSYIKNKVLYVAADTNFIGGNASFQSMGAVTRTQVGYSFNEFWGYKTNGIFQNDADIANYKNKNGQPIQPDARPGDFRFIDANGDGKIGGDEDKVFLGSNLPKYTYGLTVNMDYKGFDFLAFAQGTAGSKIFQGLRRLDILNSNYQTKALSRWHGEGTSNDYPRLTSSDPNGNFSKMSDFYLENGDYLRLKLLQVGYTIPKNVYNKIGISRLRVYVTAENLFTFTKYTGYDPEIGGFVFGVDKGQYPQARTFLGGIQVQF